MSEFWALARLFGELSVLAVGGVAPILPEMMRQVVQVHGYMDRPTFTALYGLAQAAPGPNMLISTAVGFKVAGVPGAVAATAGMIGPSSVLTFVTARLWEQFREQPWRRAIQIGLVPVTVGLVCAGAALLVQTTTSNLLSFCVTLVTAALVLRTQIHPLLMLAAGAVVAMAAG